VYQKQCDCEHRKMQQANELLEISEIETVHGGTALYGISYAAVRSVASGGKVCVIALDTAGAATLFKDDRIEAAFAYVVPPSLAELERRLRARLKEAPSTIAKRMDWAQAQVHPRHCVPTMRVVVGVIWQARVFIRSMASPMPAGARQWSGYPRPFQSLVHHYMALVQT